MKIQQYTDRHFPSNLTLTLKPDFIESTYSLINSDLERLHPSLVTRGEAYVPKKEVIPEEEIVEREEAKALEELSPYGERFVAPEAITEKAIKRLEEITTKEEIEKEMLIRAEKELPTIISQVKKKGGIKYTKEIKDFGEYAEIPLTAKNKNGLALDEMADELGLDENELWQKLTLGKREYMHSLGITKEFLNKTLRKPSDITVSTEKAMYKWYSESNEGLLYGKQIGDAIQRRMKVLNISKDRMEIIDKYREMPTKYEEEATTEEKSIADELGRIFDMLHKTASDNGVLEAYIDLYVPHIYKDDPREVWKKMYPAGGKRMGQQFRFAKKRTIPTFDEAEELELHPIYDIPTLVSVYTTSLYRTIANKNYIETAKQMVDEDGIPLLMRADKAPPDYQVIDEPAFNRYMYVGETGKEEPMLVKIPVKAHPDIAKEINDMTAIYKPYNKWVRGLRKGQNVVKRLIMYNPLIHGTNILSDTLDELNFDPIKTFNNTFRGKIPQKLMDELDFKNTDDLDMYMVQSGIASDAVWGASREMYERLNEIRGKKPAKVLQPLIKLRELNDKVLWGSIVLNSQRMVFLNYMHQELVKHPDIDQEQLAREAAHFTNDLLGTLPSVVFSKNEALVSNLFLFARNWTVSNLRLLTGAFREYGTATRLPGLLRHKGLTPEEANRLAPHYQKHLVKGMIGLVLGVIMTNSAIKSIRRRKASLWTPLEAEKGHRLDIDTGLRDKKGRKIYIKYPLFRYMGDYIGYGTQPMQTIKNKTEPLLKTIAEEAVNYSLWQKQPITDRQGINALKDRLVYFFRGTTPLGTAYGVTQEAKPTWEKFVPLTGTWTKHGVTPELVTRFNAFSNIDRRAFLQTLSGEEGQDFNRLKSLQTKRRELTEEELDRAAKYALKMIEFRKEISTKWDDIDKEIDKLILDNKIREARQLMVSSGRYTTTRGMDDRIRRVKGGILVGAGAEQPGALTWYRNPGE